MGILDCLLLKTLFSGFITSVVQLAYLRYPYTEGSSCYFLKIKGTGNFLKNVCNF